MSDTPIFFLVGAPRSGTTALANALSAHREVLCHHELRVVEWAVGSATLAATGRAIIPGRPNDFRRALHAGAPLLRRLLADRGAAEGKRVVGEKYPPDSLRVGHLRAALPDARFIFLLRDGRDVVSSVRSTSLQRRTWRRGARRSTVSEAASDWVGFTQAAADGLADAGDLALTIRYEDIEADPSDAASRLEGFLGVGACSDFRAALSGYRSRRTWRATLTPEEQAEFRAHPTAEALLARFGYPPTPAPLAPPRSRAALLAEASSAADAGRADAPLLLGRLLDLSPPDDCARDAARRMLARQDWPESVWAVMVVQSWRDPTFSSAVQSWAEGRGLRPGVSIAALEAECAR